MTGRRLRRAIVLSGGGARGAYEAGVVRYVLQELPRRLGHPPRLDILCGTSVGALTACWLAATADQGAERAHHLEQVWGTMRGEQLLRLSGGRSLTGWSSIAFEALRAVAGALRATVDRDAPPLFAVSRGLLDRAPFDAVLVRAIPFERIARNCAAGHFRSISVTATEIASGRAMVFLESRHGPPRHWTPDPTIVARPVAIRREHALASAAIPVIFPTVTIDGSQYVDGALRLNTPLVPALRFGADRILVVALRGEGGETIGQSSIDEPLALLGKVLSALLLDPVDADIGRLRFLNDVLHRGARTFGPDFLERLNETAMREGAQRLRFIEETVIRPSEDPRSVAQAAQERLRKQGRLPTLLSLLARSAESAGAASDLFSYILFDAEYTSAMCDLGYEDARRHEAELVSFFSD